MSDRIYRTEPNPIITKGIAEFNTPVRMFKDNRPIVILPDSMLMKSKACLGTVGYINEDYLYPFQLFGDIGCGTLALIIDEDVELPDNLAEIVAEIRSELYVELEEENILGIDFNQYTGDIDNANNILNQKIYELWENGDDDKYITDSIIIGTNPVQAVDSDEYINQIGGGVNQSQSRVNKLAIQPRIGSPGQA